MAFGIAEGAGILGSILGLGESSRQFGQSDEYMEALARLARMQGGQYQQYAPGMNALLWQIAQNPQADPWFRTQMRGAETDINKYFSTALPRSMMQFGGRGMGDSLFARNAAMQIMGIGGRAMAGERMGQMGQMHGRRMGALGQLGGAINPQAAMGTLGQLAGVHEQRGEAMAGGVGDILGLLAQSRYRQPRPPSGVGRQAGGTGGAQFRPTYTLGGPLTLGR